MTHILWDRWGLWIQKDLLISAILSICLPLLFICRAAGGEFWQPVQSDVSGLASQRSRDVPVRRLQFSGQGLGFSLQQGQPYQLPQWWFIMFYWHCVSNSDLAFSKPKLGSWALNIRFQPQTPHPQLGWGTQTDTYLDKKKKTSLCTPKV